jgi:DNA-binding MarR family transcriptional regulator
MAGMTPVPQPGELLLLLQQFTLETDRYVETISERNALHRTDLNALAFLVQAARTQTPVTPGKLGEALNLSSPATTALVDRLDRAGHVQRDRTGSDRRKVQLSMTEHARQVGSSLFAPLAQHLGAAIEQYSAEERAVAERFVRDMVAATVRARAAAALPTADPSGSATPGADHPEPAPLAVPATEFSGLTSSGKPFGLPREA